MTAPGPEATHAASFDYALWTESLGAIVTPEGKVDYTVLDPAARERQITSCAMCPQHLDALPDYSSRDPYQSTAGED
jgi:hypothetical protein